LQPCLIRRGRASLCCFMPWCLVSPWSSARPFQLPCIGDAQLPAHCRVQTELACSGAVSGSGELGQTCFVRTGFLGRPAPHMPEPNRGVLKEYPLYRVLIGGMCGSSSACSAAQGALVSVCCASARRGILKSWGMVVTDLPHPKGLCNAVLWSAVARSAA